MEYRLSAGVILRRDNQILLAKRSNTGYEDGKYGLVAGHIEQGETVAVAAIREAREEIGIGISESDLEIAGVMHRISDATYVDFFLSCSKWSGEPINNEPEKCSEIKWVNSNQLPTNTIPYVAIALELSNGPMWFHQLDTTKIH